jgi:hypothetical protein
MFDSRGYGFVLGFDSNAGRADGGATSAATIRYLGDARRNFRAHADAIA